MEGDAIGWLNENFGKYFSTSPSEWSGMHRDDSYEGLSKAAVDYLHSVPTSAEDVSSQLSVLVLYLTASSNVLRNAAYTLLKGYDAETVAQFFAMRLKGGLVKETLEQLSRISSEVSGGCSFSQTATPANYPIAVSIINLLMDELVELASNDVDDFIRLEGAHVLAGMGLEHGRIITLLEEMMQNDRDEYVRERVEDMIIDQYRYREKTAH